MIKPVDEACEPMNEHEPDDRSRQILPPLLRFLGLHLALGAAAGVAIVSLMLLGNLAGMKKLIVEAQNPFIPLLLLYAFNIITFSSVSMGIGIMTMPLETPGDEHRQNDGPDGLRHSAIEIRQRRHDRPDVR